MYSNTTTVISSLSWILSLFLHIIIPHLTDIKKRAFYTAFKAILYQLFLIEIFHLKYKNHRISLTPSLINLALRNFTEHFIFGVFETGIYVDIIHISWFLIDTFKFLHLILNNRVTGTLKYWISIPIHILHSILECISICYASKKLYFLFKYFLLLFLFAYLISIKIVVKYRICQLLWYRKSKNVKKKD